MPPSSWNRSPTPASLELASLLGEGPHSVNLLPNSTRENAVYDFIIKSYKAYNANGEAKEHGLRVAHAERVNTAGCLAR